MGGGRVAILVSLESDHIGHGTRKFSAACHQWCVACPTDLKPMSPGSEQACQQEHKVFLASLYINIAQKSFCAMFIFYFENILKHYLWNVALIIQHLHYCSKIWNHWETSKVGLNWWEKKCRLGSGPKHSNRGRLHSRMQYIYII